MESRTDFLVPRDTERDPSEPNLKNPEIANWGEIDPELEGEVTDCFNRALKRNQTDLNTTQKLVRLAAIIGILGGGLVIDKKFNESRIQEGAKDIVGSLANTLQEEGPSAEVEQQEAVEAIKAQEEQAAAEEFHKEQTAKEAAIERREFATPEPYNQIPETVLDQNFEGLDTSNLK